MRVLVACECSGRVRDAFRARGHDAVSCDLKPSATDGPHIQGDCLKVLNTDFWDMLIAFPPCTYLSCATPLNHDPDPERAILQHEAVKFFFALYHAPIDRICVENPQGMINGIKKPTQRIDPFLFGEPICKRTYLWLRGLPPLYPTKVVRPCQDKTERWWNSGGRKGRQASRAVTFQGVAEAMAEQWGQIKQPWLSPLGI